MTCHPQPRAEKTGRVAALSVLLLFALSGPTLGGPKKNTPAAEPPGGRGAPADATWAGDEACAACHGDHATQFAVSIHGRLRAFELAGAGGRCESCHGAGSAHIEGAGDKDKINGFTNTEARASQRVCFSCHADNTATHWKGSEHATAGLACSSCHTIHQARRATTPLQRPLRGANPLMVAKAAAPPPRASLKKAEPELCYDCHRDKRGQMNQPSHHPVREGRMACSSCHDTHGGTNDHLLKNAESEKAFCTNCHPNKHGPFVFEHAAVEEGCHVCHQPHGTIADNLLKQNEPFLCLQCHEAHFHIGREGITTPLSLPTAASNNPHGLAGWRKAFTTKCTQCHSQIHGSDLPSQGVSSRGKALTR